MEIINLTSLAWKGRERYSVVAHSFRVMAKAKNFDEMVVGMMHELYAASAYTRGLYHCDVDGDPQWGMSLDLFTSPVRIPRYSLSEEVTDKVLLGANMPQGMFEKAKEKWIIDQTRWNPKYLEWIRKIGNDRIARNVMIYDLEDKLDILLNPTKYVEELGPQYFVLPWKKHYCVNVRFGRNANSAHEVPRTDDPILLREITEDEREDLIEKYTYALDHLRWVEDCHPSERVYSKQQQQEHANICNQWFNDWVSQEESNREMYEREMDEYDSDQMGDEEERYEQQECSDGDNGVSVGDHGSPC
jgi:hypothetical protein